MKSADPEEEEIEGDIWCEIDDLDELTDQQRSMIEDAFKAAPHHGLGGFLQRTWERLTMK